MKSETPPYASFREADSRADHHQEFKTVHRVTGICQTSRQKYLFDVRLLLYVQSRTPDDGRKDRPKHVERHYKIK